MHDAIASVAGFIPETDTGAYVAAKHGVIGLTKTAAIENAARGIRVNALAPGWVRTALTKDLESDNDLRACIDRTHDGQGRGHSFFGAGQRDRLAKAIEQRGSAIDAKAVLGAVDAESDRDRAYRFTIGQGLDGLSAVFDLACRECSEKR